MSERPPSGEQERRSPRDEAILRMVHGGWANASAGSVFARTGIFYRMSNTTEELPEIIGAFEDEFAEAGFSDYDSVLGHFLVLEKDERAVVLEAQNNWSLELAFRGLQQLLREEGDAAN